MAALLAIAAACTKEETLNDVSNLEGIEYNHNAPVFKATVGETKAVLDAIDGNKVKWEASDHISVWNGTQAADYVTAGSGDSADFTTTDDFASAGSYTALYPKDGDAVFNAGSVTTTLPAAQTATAAGFDPAANIAVASSTTTSLSFHNAVAYVKFTVPAGMDDLTSVSFKGNSGEKVAGACSVNTGTYALTATGSETATLSGTFTEGTTYYLAVAPQAYSAGYTVTITRTSGTYEMVSKATSITFERTKARDIGNLWDGSYVVSGSAIATPTDATRTVGPRSNSNAALKEYTYSYSGTLSAGTVSIKKAYSSTVSGSATVPANGWYHLFYNETTDTFKIYDQELKVNFGNADYASGMESISSTTASSTANMTDQNGETSHGVIVTLGDGFTGTTNDGSYKANTSWDFWIEDYSIPSGLLASTLITTGTATVVVSGLNPSAKYDFRISGARFNGTNSGRVTEMTIGGVSKSYKQGISRSADPDTQYRNASTIPFRNQVLLFENVTSDPSGDVTITIKQTTLEACIGFIFISRVVE